MTFTREGHGPPILSRFNMTFRETLLKEIKEYNRLYRAGTPVISDAEYDAKVDHLRRIDPDNEWFKRPEPVPVQNSRKTKLPIPMKSLDKVKTTSELDGWVKSLGIRPDDFLVVMPKFDGLSLLYDETSGAAYSRGGAENEGQDCTAHVKAARIAPSKGIFGYTFGEFVFSVRLWNEHFSGKTSPETGDKYKSPRNTAAGLLNRDTPSELLKYIDFYRYGTDEASLSQFTTFSEMLESLCGTFRQPELFVKTTPSQISENMLHSLFDEWSKEYYIDGLVIYANDLSVWKRTGRQATSGNPNYAIAYKNPNFTAVFTTKVNGVNWNISKSGAFKPVVAVDTVDNGDCEMENPTGYNAKYIFENNIGAGAEIKITRSGGVIPKILEVTVPASSDTMGEVKAELAKCPHCGQPTRWNESGTDICCPNPDCPGTKLAKIVFFYTIAKAENMGSEIIAKIFNAGYQSLNLMLDITFDELLDIDGFGESIANNILTQNHRIREGMELPLLMHASDCFSGIGEVKAKQILAKMCDTELKAFIEGYCDAYTPEQLQIFDWFLNESKTMQSFHLGIRPFYEFIAANRLTVLSPKEDAKPTSDKYAGVRVCFSGIRDNELEAEIIAGGGEVCSGVSKKTTHLIVADKNGKSNKIQCALRFGTPILTIDEFRR